MNLIITNASYCMLLLLLFRLYFSLYGFFKTKQIEFSGVPTKEALYD